MTTARLIQDGDTIDYTPSGNVDAGDVVVQNDLVGVATRPIAAGVLGALTVQGVFSFPKASGVLSAGKTLYWKAASAIVKTNAASGILLGKVTATAATGDTLVSVRLYQ